jgi:hypothetical protein
MKKLLKTIIVIIIILFGLLTLYKLYKENDTMIAIIEYYTRKNSKLENNIWQINSPNNYVKITNEFSPKNRVDLLNLYYTVLASGMNEFIFYCDVNYEECINDVKDLTKDDMILSHVNGFVHVYNSYNTISTEYRNNGKVYLKINRLYTKEQIDMIDKEVNRLFDELYNEKKSIRDNLRIIHDYIIDHTKYDLEYIDKTTDRLSNTAYAPLFDKYAICSGYTDLMALFLYKMNIANIRVSNETHTWNMIYLENEKLIIDLTYDDPVTPDKTDFKRHDYFLITPDKLQELDNDHYYNKDIYLK